MRVSVLLFMIGSLAGVGLRVDAKDAFLPLRQARFLTVSLVASWMVCPVVAVAVLHFIPLAEPYAAGLLLLSLAPCAPFAPAVVRIAKGDTSALAAFMVFSAVTTVIVMPIGVSLTIDSVNVSMWRIARPLLLFILTPLACGMALRQVAPGVAARLRPAIEKITAASGLLLFVVVVVLYGRGIIDAYGSYAILAQMIFLL